MGRLPADRQSVYRGLFDGEPDAGELVLLRYALQTGTPLSNEKFKAKIAAALDLKVGFARCGRQMKKALHGDASKNSSLSFIRVSETHEL